jgi:hypothetical protein
LVLAGRTLARPDEAFGETVDLPTKLWRVFFLGIVFISGKQLFAQTPAASGPSASDDSSAGPTLTTSFNGSVASQSNVYDWTTTAGYVFDRHFSADIGVPFVFVHGTSSTGTTTSSSGLGNVFGQFQFTDKNPLLNFGAVATVALPTGDSSKGLSTGRITADLTGQIAKPLGRFTPFVTVGVGNSLFDSSYWQRPYITLGNVAHFEGGTTFNLGWSLTLSASLYDIAPWGDQKVYSRVVAEGVASGPASKHGRVFLDNSLSTGSSSIDSDNGLNAGLNFTPAKFVDVAFAYLHSVHFQTDVFSFGVGVNLSSLLRRGAVSRN